MANYTKKLPITYDSSVGDMFILQKDSEQTIFNQIPPGLWFHESGACVILIVGTTKEKCEGYTRREIVAATEARAGIYMVGNPSSGDYINVLRSGLIHNCPITIKTF